MFFESLLVFHWARFHGVKQASHENGARFHGVRMYSLSFQFKTKHIAFGRLSLAHEPAVLLSGACLPNLKEAMSTKPTSSPRYSLTYYKSRNSKSLGVIHWGPATRTDLVRPWRRLQRIEWWRVLWVNAYVREAPGKSQFYGEPGWVYFGTFPVMQWSEIPNVFQEYFAEGGPYQRVCFHVEAWIWTEQCGWTCDDQI